MLLLRGGRAQAFLWDAKVSGLALRVTAGGARTYVFQSRLKDGATLRMTYIPHFEWRIRSQLRVQFGRIRAWPDVLRR